MFQYTGTISFDNIYIQEHAETRMSLSGRLMFVVCTLFKDLSFIILSKRILFNKTI